MNNNIYIPSIEASDIWSHINRGTKLRLNHKGMIPCSLELIKLQSIKGKYGFKQRMNRAKTKQTSMDIINVNFDSKVRTATEIIELLEGKLVKLENKRQIKLDAKKKDESETILTSGQEDENECLTDKQVEYKNELSEAIKMFETNEDEENFNSSIGVDRLRKILYLEPFKIQWYVGIDKEGNDKFETVEYVVYKRSSAKSRDGKCLMIKTELYDEMIKWSRMGLVFDENKKMDLASLLAYESLVGSSISSEVIIKPENMLIIDDVKSVFKKDCNVVKIDDETKHLVSVPLEKATITNDIWDGQSLLSSEFFEEGVSMKLLRNHFFKSCSFQCDIKRFMIDNCPEGIKFDEWALEDMFGNSILAKDVKFIYTPNSLKALKFSYAVGEDKDMYEYWRGLVEREGCTFGVVKSEKSSKRGHDEEGSILQQTSYQMINSLPLSSEEVAELMSFEENFVHKLKTDDNFFIQYLKDNANEMNSYEMFASIYDVNKDIVKTEQFSKMRIREASDYVQYLKKGKLRLKGDYCVMVSNPLEMIYASINKLDGTTITKKGVEVLEGNEVSTKLFDYDNEYVGFRNPHTSPSNVLIVKNKQVKELDKYFTFNKNIVIVNSIGFEIQDILSSADFDSDCVCLFSSSTLLEAARKCFGHYKICLNGIKPEPIEYQPTKEGMYKTDKNLSKSTKCIGSIVNAGQHVMSHYWDKKSRGEDVSEELKRVDIATILSCVAIDLAKKMYAIDMEGEIKRLSSGLGLKPLFFQQISKSKKIKNKVRGYNTPMDFVYETNFEREGGVPEEEKVEFKSLLKGWKINKADRKQYDKIMDIIEDSSDEIKNTYAKYTTKDGSDLSESKEKERDSVNEHIIPDLLFQFNPERKLK